MMSDNLKDLYHKDSTLKDIEDRKQIVQTYRITGRLDRAKAIKKIRELRLTDEDIAKEATARLAVSSTPFSKATDQGIVAELQMQIAVLIAKLPRNQG